jgi:hypothetical protein
MSDYDKFITPNLNRVKNGNVLGASRVMVVNDSPKIADREDKQAAQKLLADESYKPISLSAIGIGLISLMTMLGVRLRRGLQPAGELNPDMPMKPVSAVGDNVMEMKSQDPNIKVNSGRVGWGQLSSNNSRPQTLCCATTEDMDASVGIEDIDVKDELLGIVGAAVGDSVSSDLRDEVSELLIKLEGTNPTSEPATSALLNGVWDVVYQGYAPGPLPSPTRPLALALYAGGFTPGVAGLTLARMLPDTLADVGSLEVAITRDQPRVTASVNISLAGLGSQDIEVQTSLEVETDIRLKETYASLKAFGEEQDIPSSLRYSRKLFVTYLDEDILVMRDESGVPDVLLRKGTPEGAALPDEGVPSDGSDEDAGAPGA